MIWLLSNLASALLGLILGVFLEPKLEEMRERLARRWRAMTRRAQIETPVPENFSLGIRRFPFLVIDGDGEHAYRPSSIRTIVEEEPVDLPAEIAQLKHEIESRENEKRTQGLPAQWNGPFFALDRYAIGRSIPDEGLELTLVLRRSDYFSFQATVMSLDKNLMQPPAELTLRQRYLLGTDLTKPVPFLAQGFGVALVVISEDQKLIFSRRSHDAGARSGELDITFVEGVHPNFDRASDHPGPDFYRTAIRGAKEEVGLDLFANEIVFLGFGVDTEYYQWQLLGMARSRGTAREALEPRRRGTAGKWEARRFELLDFNPSTVFEFLASEDLWAVGWVAVYWALVHEFGRRKVDEVARKLS